MPSQTELRRQITAQIIESLEKDLVPWYQPWRSSPNAGRPANIVSKRTYSGINPLLLAMHSEKHGLTSRWFGTFKQWDQLGFRVQARPSQVKPGEWAATVVFYKPVKVKKKNSESGEEIEEEIPLLRTYHLFSADQVDGAEAFRVAQDEVQDVHPDFETAEALIAATEAEIVCGKDRACYVRPKPFESWPNHSSGDHIEMPNRCQFTDGAAYFMTLFHEASHWAEIRTGWDHRKHGYAAGELAAEVASCFLASELGIPVGDLSNHAAYLRHWLAAMKEDPSYVFRVTSQASKVTDYLMSFVPRPEPVEAR